jgi:hypothetical protein
MSLLRENMELAKKAIKYVDKLGITSVNVPFRLGSYSESPLSMFDRFMLYYTRAESNTSDDMIHYRYKDAKDDEMDALGRRLGQQEKSDLKNRVTTKLQDTKAVKSQIKTILRSTASKSQKKQQLKDLMKQSNFNGDPYSVDWFMSRTDAPDENRIRSVRKAIKFRHGNCGEKSAIAATWLLEQTKNGKTIYWVSAQNWDHAWCVMANAGSLPLTTVGTSKYKGWPDDTVVADGWTSDWYPLLHPYNAIKGTAANPFQLYVRKKVQEAQAQLDVMDALKWPPVFAPTFRLEVAAQKNSTYMQAPIRVQVLDLADDPREVEQEYEDAQK